jgi:glutamyl-tRNA reductase
MKQPAVWLSGINHDTAPVAVREQFALSGNDLDRALRIAQSLAVEAIILSTCNRLEIYALLPGERPDRLLQSVFGDAYPQWRAHSYTHKGDVAASHLFRVVSGIDSLVLGEVQILGQVQRAWQAAHKAGAAGPVLSQLFHRAVALGKRVHSETPISRLPASVSYAAVVLARQILGPQLEGRHVLVIGTGEVGEGVARCLYDNGMHATVVAHRQLERAQDMARRYHADTSSWDELPRALGSSDIVISSTAAPHYILQHQHIADAMFHRGGRPLYLIDLAVPRDIDPSVMELPGVHLHNVDDLQAVVRTTMEERQSALPEIGAMIDIETARFSDWLKSRSTAPTIKEMHEQAGELTRRELDWALAKMPDLTDRERQVVEAMASRLAGKLLHGPIQWLKAQAEAAHLAHEEPDYGMNRLTPSEIAELFYRSGSAEDATAQE